MSFEAISDNFFLFVIKNENISAISSEGVDIEYSVKKPWVLFIKDKPDLLEQVEHSALGKLLERPNPAQSWAVFLEELIGFGKLTGNRYVYGISPENGENRDIYYQLYNLPAHLIEIKSDGIFKPVSKYTMMYNDNKYDFKLPFIFLWNSLPKCFFANCNAFL